MSESKKPGRKRKPKKPPPERDKPLSLHPLSFDEAVAALLKVKPPERKRRRKRHGKEQGC